MFSLKFPHPDPLPEGEGTGFHHFRNKRKLTQPDTQGSFWKLT